MFHSWCGHLWIDTNLKLFKTVLKFTLPLPSKNMSNQPMLYIHCVGYYSSMYSMADCYRRGPGIKSWQGWEFTNFWPKRKFKYKPCLMYNELVKKRYNFFGVVMTTKSPWTQNCKKIHFIYTRSLLKIYLRFGYFFQCSQFVVSPFFLEKT